MSEALDFDPQFEPDPVMIPTAPVVIHGRGALGNPTGRFESIQIEPCQLDSNEAAETDELAGPQTQYFKDNSQSVVNFNDSPDIGFDASINPYRGCEHGCIYCYARPTHEYLGLSAGLDFESKIFVKENAPQLLRKKLASKSWQPQCIAMSGVTDCYQPIEKMLTLTRQCLEVLLDFRNPVGIVTKNYLVTRDSDILGQMAQMQLAVVMISITTLDEDLANLMEPRTAKPHMRLKAIRELTAAGIPVGVMMAPIIPGLTDHEIDRVLAASAEAGARTVHYTMLRLPYGNKALFENWLLGNFPDRRNRVLNRIRDVRNGELNDSRFGNRMRGEGNYAAYIDQMFSLAKKRHGLTQGMPALSTAYFRNPDDPPNPIVINPRLKLF